MLNEELREHKARVEEDVQGKINPIYNKFKQQFLVGVRDGTGGVTISIPFKKLTHTNIFELFVERLFAEMDGDVVDYWRDGIVNIRPIFGTSWDIELIPTYASIL